MKSMESVKALAEKADAAAGGAGLRYNAGKRRYDLLPTRAIEALADVMTKGSLKYAPRNWEKGMSWTSVVASLKRHLAAFEKSEDFDPETGLLHMAHVMCNAAFLVEYYKIAPQYDDRPHDYLKDRKIGLDIDEVLCDWIGAWKEKWGIEKSDSWFFDRKIKQRFEAMKGKELDEFYMSLKPKIDPKDIPFDPACYITSRPVDTEVTAAWLDLHGFPTRPVYTVPVHTTKVEIAKEAGIDTFVDDSFINFVQLNKAGINCYLWDAPHNQKFNVGFKRIKSFNEI